jgi:hypothetical protein
VGSAGAGVASGGGGGLYNTAGGRHGVGTAESDGSGVVIIRHLDTLPAATTGSPTITVTGGFRIYKFTTSGSITF